jgi:hypothetical protein
MYACVAASASRGKFARHASSTWRMWNCGLVASVAVAAFGQVVLSASKTIAPRVFSVMVVAR